jgi:hypothetical protein
MATVGEAPRGDDERRDNNGNGYVQGEGGRGEGNCGGGGSGDGGGNNGNDNNGGGNNDNDGIDYNDDGGNDMDDNVSNDDHNGGNGGGGGSGGCKTETAIGIDSKVNSQLKAAMTPDADGPEVAVEAMASGAMVHPCEFFDFVAWEQRSLSRKVLFPPKEQDPVFNLDSLNCYRLTTTTIANGRQGEIFIFYLL